MNKKKKRTHTYTHTHTYPLRAQEIAYVANVAAPLATAVTKRLFTDASPTGSHKFERLSSRMIIPLPRSFRQKSDAHLTKTKVATGKAARRDEGRERNGSAGQRAEKERKKEKKSKRWWKNRGSGRKNKKNTERGRERERARKREEGRERERKREREVRRRTHHPLPSLIYRRYPSTLRALVRARSLARRPPLYTLARVQPHTNTLARVHVPAAHSRAHTESRSHPPAARVSRPPHPVSSTLARPACSRPLRVSAARSNHPVPRRVPQGMSLYAADLQLSALSPLASISPRDHAP